MTRVEQELDLVRSVYPDAEQLSEDGVHWVRIPKYAVPASLFKQDEAVELAFRIPVQAGEAPYGFWVRPGLEPVSGQPVSNYSYPAATPWGADWGQFSWSPLDPWVPKTDIRAGANMLNFVSSFADRLREGA